MRSLALLTAPLALAALALACSDDRPIATPPVPNSSTCGNGRLDPGETCDRLIPTSSVGACPATCFDGIACTVDRKLGSSTACNAACAFDPITACVNGDGCCPEGCTGATDDDCSATCGNATVDQGETCDGDCPASCDDNTACTLDAAYGAATTCSFTCGYRVVAPGTCNAGDGCCPAGCTADQDSDCSRTCGNGMVELGELCDGNCPTTCEDGDACTIGILSGSPSTCNAACTQQRVRACNNGDGCCPSGCTSANDNDCGGGASCETVTACVGGDTCCPSGCSSANDTDCAASCSGVTACTSGDSCCPSGCSTSNDSDCGPAPTCSGVTACTGGDTCCPSGCTHANDSDCPAPPASGVGAPCANSAACSAIGSGATCFQDGYPGGYCTAFCTSDPCPSGSQCDIQLFFCVDECSPGNPSDCRSGYVCQQSLNQFEQTYFGCVPAGS